MNFGKVISGENDHDFIPATYILPKDINKLKSKLDSEGGTFIGKPN